MSKDHADAGTGNTSVLGNYPVPRVIDLDKELLLIYLKFSNLPMKALLRIAYCQHKLPVREHLAYLTDWLECPSPFNLGNFIKISKIGQASRKLCQRSRENKAMCLQVLGVHSRGHFSPLLKPVPTSHTGIWFLFSEASTVLHTSMKTHRSHKYPPVLNRNLALTLFTNGTH